MGNLRGRCSALVKLKLPSAKDAQVFWEALKPETKSPATPRSRVRIERKGSLLIFHFEATDTTALRASLNSYLSWMHLLKSLRDLLEEEPH
ncbi:hypothetical protein DRO22_00590 [Candidatus Bathyarchaeota archaeon]|nr:MAG: hypothetical protein DRO22_00590 [Candidatus Bathyarchaeota archaeon]